MSTFSTQQLFDSIDSSMAEVVRRLASGELDVSGRFWTDAELAAGAATQPLHVQTSRTPKGPKPSSAPVKPRRRAAPSR